MSQIHFHQRVISYTLIYLVAVQPVLPVWAESTPPADIAVMAVADGKSSLDKAGNGVPIVDIATPNGAGVSYNAYHQFNVGSQGLILNNATEPLTSTQLGGVIQNNPHLLASGAANTIINEVISPHPSVLQGYLEVAGTAAGVMVANPYGITCDGCGFIHTPDATLTTGRPLFDVAGQWSGLDVTGGAITVKGQGIDASQSNYFSLIARAMEINAGIHAKTLRVTAGANRINGQHQAVSQPGNGKAPRLAVDAGMLGGMYADNIILLATEQGVGVNLHNLTARSGDIQLDAQGKITLNQAVAGGSLRATGAELQLAGTHSAQGEMAFTSRGVGTLDKVALAAGNRLTIQTDGRLTATDSQLSAGVDSAGNIGEQGALTLRSGGLALHNTRGTAAQLTANSSTEIHQDAGSYLTARNLNLSGQQLTLAGQLAARDTLLLSGRGLQGSKTAVIDSHKNLRVTLTDKNLWQGQMRAGSDFSLQANELTNAGQLLATQRLRFDGNRLDNQGQIFAAELALTAPTLHNSGTLQGNNAITLAAADTFTQAASGVVNTGTVLTLNAAQMETRGELHSQALTVTGNNWTNRAQVVAQTLAKIRLQQQLDNHGVISSDGETVLDVASLNNPGQLQADQLTLTGQTAHNAGRLQGKQHLTLMLDDGYHSTLDGILKTDGLLTVKAPTIDNQGRWENGALSVAAQQMTHSGAVLSTGGVDLQIAKTLTNLPGGKLFSHDALHITADTVDNQGLLQGSLSLVLEKLRHYWGAADSQLLSRGDAHLTAEQIVNRGLVQADTLRLTSDALENGGTLAGLKQLNINNRTALTNLPDGKLFSHDALSLTTDQLVNQGLVQGNQLALNAGTLANHGNLTGLSALAAMVADSLNNHGKIFTQGAGILHAGSLSQRGDFQAKRWQIYAATLDNYATLTASEALDVTLTGKAHNHATGQLRSEGSSHLTAPEFTNAGLWQANSLSLTADNALNSGRLEGTEQATLQLKKNYTGEKASVLVSGGDASLTAAQIANSGTLQGKTLALTGDSFDNSGTALGTDQLTLRLTGDITNSADGQLLAEQRLQADGKRLNNQGQVAATTLALTGDTLANSGTLHGDTVTLSANHRFTQADAGVVRADHALTLNTAQTETAGKLLTPQLTVKGERWRNRAEVLAQDIAHITLGQLDNEGVMASDGETTLNVATLNNPGKIQTDKLTLTGQTANNAGRLQGKQQLTLTLDKDYHSTLDGILKTDGLLTLNAPTLDNQGLWESGALTVAAQQLTNGGAVLSLGAMDLQIAKTLTNLPQGELLTDDTLTVQAGTLINQGIGQGRTLAITTDALDNAGELSGTERLTLSVADTAVNQPVGQLLTSGPLSLNGGVWQNLGTARGRTLATKMQALDNHGWMQGSEALTLGAQSRLHNSEKGRLFSAGLGQLSAAHIDNQGIAQAAELSLTSDTLHNNGRLHGETQLTLTTHGDQQLGSLSDLYSPGVLNATAQRIDNQGLWQAGRLTLNAQTLTHGGSLQARDALAIRLAGDYQGSAGSEMISHGGLQLKAGKVGQAGTLEADTLAINATQLTNSGSMLGLNGLTLRIQDKVDNQATGQLLSNGIADIAARLLTNHGAVQGADLLLTVRELLNHGRLQGNQSVKIPALLRYQGAAGSQLLSEGRIDIVADDFSGQGLVQSDTLYLSSGNVTHDGTLAGLKQLQITSRGALTNQANGKLLSDQTVTLNANALNNHGQVQGKTLALTAPTLSNSGTLTGLDLLTATATGSLDNSGKLLTQGNATVQAGAFTHSGFAQARHWQLNAGSLDNSGTLVGIDGLNLTLTGAAHNRGTGQLLTEGDSRLTATTFTNEGKWQAGALFLTAESAVNAGRMEGHRQATVQMKKHYTGTKESVLVSGGKADLTAPHIANDGIIQGKALTLSGTTLLNPGTVQGTDALTLRLSGDLTTQAGGRLLSGDKLALTAPHIINQAHIQARHLSLSAQAISNSGTLQGDEALTLTSTGALDNLKGGQLLSSGTATLGAQHLTNAGWIQSAHLTSKSQQLSNQGTLMANGTLQLNAPTLNNQGTAQGQDVTLVSNQLTNSGTLLGLTRLGIQAVTLDNRSGGKLFSAQDLHFATTYLQQNGQLAALGELTGDLRGGLDFSGVLAAGKRLSLNIAGALQQRGVLQGDSIQLSSQGAQTHHGTLTAGSAGVTLNAQTIQLEANSRLQAGGNSALVSRNAINNRGFVGTAGNLLLQAAGTLHNTSLLYAGGSMRLLSASLHNVRGDILAGEHLTIQKDEAGHANQQIINSSGNIETQRGNIVLKTAELRNQREGFSVNEAGEVPINNAYTKYTKAISAFSWDHWRNWDEISQSWDAMLKEFKYITREKLADDHHYELFKIPASHSAVNVDSPYGAARIVAGNQLSVTAASLTNQSSQLLAGDQLLLQGETLNNQSYQVSTLTQYIRYRKHFHYGNWKWWVGGWTCDDPPLYERSDDGPTYPALIQAGGNIIANFSQDLSNTAVQAQIGGITHQLQAPTLATLTTPGAVGAQPSRALATGAGNAVTGLTPPNLGLQAISMGGPTGQMTAAGAHAPLRTLRAPGSAPLEAGSPAEAQQIAHRMGTSTPSEVAAFAVSAPVTPALRRTALSTPAVTHPTEEAFVYHTTTPGMAALSDAATTPLAVGAPMAPALLRTALSTPAVTHPTGEAFVYHTTTPGMAALSDAATAPLAVGAPATPAMLPIVRLAAPAHSRVALTSPAPLPAEPTLVFGLNATAQPVSKRQLADYPLPASRNGLFVVNAQPNSRYLISMNAALTTLGQVDNSLFAGLHQLLGRQPESQVPVEQRPQWTQETGFMTSEYLLKRLGVQDGENRYRFLGDHEFDRRYINNAVFSQTGQRHLQGFGSDLAQMQALLDNAVQAQQALDLTLGVSLSAQQVASLTGSLLWWENMEVNGQTVLAPKLYLAKAEPINVQGSSIIGQQVSIHAGSVSNNSLMKGVELLAIASNTDITNHHGGLMKSDGSLDLVALNNISNLSATMHGDSVRLTSLTGNIVNRTLTRQWTGDGGGLGVTQTETGHAAGIGASGRMRLSAGQDIAVTGAELSAGGDMTLQAGRDIQLLANRHHNVHRAADGTHVQQSGATGSSLSSGGHLLAFAGRDIQAKVATLAAGKRIGLSAQRDVTLDTEQSRDYQANYGRNITRINETVRQQGTALRSGTDTVIQARRDIGLRATDVAASGDVALKAGRDISLSSAQESDYRFYEEVQVKKRTFSKTTTRHVEEDYTTREKGAALSGQRVSLTAGNDLTLTGSSVVGEEDVTLQAGNTLGLHAATESQSHYRLHEKKTSGMFSGGGLGFTIGRTSSRHQMNQEGTTQSASFSTVGSTAGNVSLLAGGAAQIAGADVIAAQDLTVVAANIDVTPGYDKLKRSERHEQQQSGLTVALSGAMGSQLNSAVIHAEAARREKSDKLAALQSVKAALSGGQAAQTARLAAAQDSDSASNNGMGVSLSYGNQSSQSQQTLTESRSQPSQLLAGGTLAVTATGDGDIRVQGSQLQAGKDIRLVVPRDVILTSAQDTRELTGNNSSRGSSLGIVQSGRGISLSASLHQGKGSERGEGISHWATTVQAGQTLNITSGRDTVLQGAQASGATIKAKVGRDLLLHSEQDSDRYDATQQHASTGGSYSLMSQPGSASMSLSREKMRSDYASVQEQTGLFAGTGGFDVRVGEHTELKGAVIGSSATAGQNRLDTGTLGVSAIHNRADFKVERQGAGLSLGDSAGSPLGGNLANTLLMSHNRDGQASNITLSAVSDGILRVRDPHNQRQSVDTLSRDATQAHHTLSPLFDKEKEEERTRTVALIGEIGSQAMDIAGTEGKILATRAAQAKAADPAAQAAAKAQLKQDGKAVTPQAIREQAYTTAYNQALSASGYGTGGAIQQGMQAATAALQGLAGGNLKAALAQGSAPYLAAEIKKHTTDEKTHKVNVAANTMAHAVLGAVVAQASGNNALAGATGAAGGELAAGVILKRLHPGKDASDLSEEQKQTVSALSTLAAGLAGGIAGDSTHSALVGAQAGKNAVENNFLSATQSLDFDKEMQQCRASGGDCSDILAKYKKISDEQSDRLDATLQDNPLTAQVWDKEVVTRGLDITERPGWLGDLPGVAVMSDEQAKSYVQYWNAQDLAKIDKSSPAWTKFAVFVSDPENQAAGVSLGMVGKSLAQTVKTFMSRNTATTTVNAAAIGMKWGQGNMKQGMPWEEYVGKTLPANARLPQNFKTFDYYDVSTKTAVSAKSMDTQTMAKLASPNQVYSSIKGNVDAAAKFQKSKLSGQQLNSSMISSREIQLAVPANTTSAQWAEINRAIEYGKSQAVTVKVTQVK